MFGSSEISKYFYDQDIYHMYNTSTGIEYNHVIRKFVLETFD